MGFPTKAEKGDGNYAHFSLTIWNITFPNDKWGGSNLLERNSGRKKTVQW